MVKPAANTLPEVIWIKRRRAVRVNRVAVGWCWEDRTAMRMQVRQAEGHASAVSVLPRRWLGSCRPAAGNNCNRNASPVSLQEGRFRSQTLRLESGQVRRLYITPSNRMPYPAVPARLPEQQLIESRRKAPRCSEFASAIAARSWMNITDHVFTSA